MNEAQTKPPTTFSSLMAVLRLFRRTLGRRIYLLVCLTPLATISEAFGITLLLPLLARLDSGMASAASGGGAVGRMVRSIPLPDSPALLLVLIGLVFCFKGVLKFAVETTRGYFESQLVRRLRLRLVNEYSNLQYSFFSKRNSGHYINVISGQINRVSRAFTSTMQVAIQLAAATVYLTVAALVNWQFALVSVVIGLVFVLAMRSLTGYVRQLSRDAVAEYSILNKQLVQILQGLKYLMATAAVGPLINHVDQSGTRLFKLQFRSAVARGFTSAISEPLSIAVILLLIAIQIFYFQQPLAVILVALLLLDRATKALLSVQNQWQQLADLIGSVEAVRDELGACREHAERRGTSDMGLFQNSVRFEEVTFAYDASDVDVLSNVNLTIAKNQTIALVGHSGAGKSTLADLLTLLLKPVSGKISIDDIDTSTIDPRSWRRQIGYVCQETIVFDDTIAANICIEETDFDGRPEIMRRVRDAAEQAYADEFIKSLPDGYDTIVGDRGVRLSGGQRQRLFIARELFKQPALLILDEATSALDSQSERAIQDSIDALQGQMTVVIIAHRLATIRKADQIFVLDGGRIVEEGPYEMLNGDGNSKFRRMVELQSL